MEQLLSADNASRKQAEDVYEKLKAHPDGILELLLRCLRSSPHVQNRQFCAIMLRKVTRLQPACLLHTAHAQLLLLQPHAALN